MVLSTAKSQMSLAEFLQLPETKPASEYIQGEIEQKPMAKGKHSILQTRLVTKINQVGEPEKLVYGLTELRCTFGGCSIVPDIAVFEWERIPIDADGEIANQVEIAPDWIIQILSPGQSATKVMNKIIFSIQNGTQLGWFIDADDKSVMSFQANQLPEIKYNTDILAVLPVLANWQLTAADIFAWLRWQ